MKKIKIKIIVKIYKEYQSKKVLNTKTTYNKFVIIKLWEKIIKGLRI